MILDFTTTATCRPSILSKTYESFLSKLKGFNIDESTLYLNIDQIPVAQADKVIEAAGTFFKKIIHNIPASPSFPNAVKWCWLQPKNQYFFHLEDDWILEESFDVNELAQFLTDKRIACVNLRAYTYINDGRICLSPAIWRSEYAKQMADKLVPDHNPERQLWPENITHGHGGKHCGFISLQYPKNPVIKDIGREWLEKQVVTKDKGPEFTTWISKREAKVQQAVSARRPLPPKPLPTKPLPVSRHTRPLIIRKPAISPIQPIKPKLFR